MLVNIFFISTPLYGGRSALDEYSQTILPSQAICIYEFNAKIIALAFDQEIDLKLT